jgi:hypothetical protein
MVLSLICSNAHASALVKVVMFPFVKNSTIGVQWSAAKRLVTHRLRALCPMVVPPHLSWEATRRGCRFDSAIARTLQRQSRT